MRIEQFSDGHAICGDATTVEVYDAVKQLTGEVNLCICDPPYGRVLTMTWDNPVELKTDVQFCEWMVKWTRMWAGALLPGGSFYVWGGIGKVGWRPFFRYLLAAEIPGEFELANFITWAKRRGYGTKTNFLFCREECLWFIRGNAKHPRIFNIPLLDKLRGYAGYSVKYPAKSPYFRRSNVWVEPELLRGKVHVAQKAHRVIEIPIEIHTNPGDWVIDPFAGSGTTALAARKLGRRFVVIEKDEQIFDGMVQRLKVNSNEQLP